MSRAWIALAVVVAGLAGGWYVLRDRGDAVAAVSSANEPATATEREHHPVLPSNQVARTANGNPIPFWHRDAVLAQTRDTGAVEHEADTSEHGVPSPHSTTMLRPFAGTGTTVTTAEVDEAAARVEAATGQPMTKVERLKLEQKLIAQRGKQNQAEQRVPGISQMREIREKADCTGPTSQQHYRQLSDLEKSKMRQRCAKYGFVPAS